jgi:glycerol kinase
MAIINSANEVNTLAAKESDTGGVYFVTAFSSLLAPYWDLGAAGMLIGPSLFHSLSHILTAFTGIVIVSQYTNPSHIARATFEANAFQTRAIVESMKLDSGSDLKQLKVDGGMTNGDLTMSILADIGIGGFSVIRPEMREHVLIYCCTCF